MTATPGWDYRQPPAPDASHRPLDHTSEPVGFDLGDYAYQQPPAPLLGPPPVLLPSGQATAGFVVSLSCLVTMSFLPLITSPGLIVGLVLSAIALKRCRQGTASGRGLAIAGLVLGIVGLVLTAALTVLIILAITLHY